MAATRTARELSRFESPRASPGFLLWQVTNAWQRALRDALAPLELTHVQFVLLATVSWHAEHAEPPTQRELAQIARTDAMMTSQVLRVLEARGLLKRVRDPGDARAMRVSTTATGRKLAARAFRVVEAADGLFFAPLDADASSFGEMLARLASAGGQPTREES